MDTFFNPKLQTELREMQKKKIGIGQITAKKNISFIYENLPNFFFVCKNKLANEEFFFTPFKTLFLV